MSFIANGLIKFEEYEIDRARWQLSWRDETLPLNRKTFDLLLYPVDHADRVVGKDELLRTLWPESFVEESNLTQHIFLLRKALSRHGSGTKIIETVPGRGYRFTAIVTEKPLVDRMVISASESITRITLEEEEEDTSRPASQGHEVIQPLLPSPSRMRRRYWITGGSVAVVALCVACWFGWQRWLDHASGSPVDVVLIAMDGTTGDAVLDRALVDALRMDLAQSPFVTVVSSSKVRDTLTQMMHKPDDPMTPAMFREVCERTNSQAVLYGTIARVGQHFLLTEEAVSCVNEAILAEAKQEAVSSEGLPPSIDNLAASLRQKLGESRRSVARFDKPLFPQNTVSFEALKDFSQAVHDYEQGKLSEAMELDKRAIAADPYFAAAYFNMAAYDFTAEDDVNGKAAILKAYSLRESVTESLRFAISTIYNTATTQNLFETERICHNWAELYPHSLNAWNLLSNTERDLGKTPKLQPMGRLP